MGRKLLTKPFRVSFPKLEKAETFGDSKDPKFELTALISKDDDISEFKKLMNEAIVEKWSDPKKRPPVKNLWNPIRDGSEEKPDLPGYDGNWFIKFSRMEKAGRPPVVDRDMNPIMDYNEVYAGCWARATVTCFAWHHLKTGKKGVSFTLEGVQKIKDGEAFGARPMEASSMFDALPDEDMGDAGTGTATPGVEESNDGMFY